MKADLLIRNGRVIDCYANIDERRDLAVKDGVMVDAGEVSDAVQTVDADGCIVTPGLIDFHAHTFVLSSDLAVYPEALCFPTGVTTIVDCGSSGCSNFESFDALSRYSRVRQFAFLHVNPSGIPTTIYPEQHDPRYYDEAHMLELFQKYPGQLLGIKVRESRDVVGELGLEPLKRALAIAEKAGVRVACHVTDGPAPSDELVSLFRAGDIYAHVFHGRGYTILGEDGHVMPAFFEAKKRGVLFDAANGRSHFAFRVARAALADGFLPDIISTDATTHNSWKPGAAFSLPYTLSRYLTLGVTVNQVIACATLHPARALGEERELGSLETGTCADIAVHRLIDKEAVFADPLGDSCVGKQLLRTEMTVRGGEVVYRDIAF